MSRNALIGLGFLTLFGFSGIGALIIYYGLDVQVGAVFVHGWHWSVQVLGGSVLGVISGLVCWAVIKSKLMSGVRNFYVEMIQDLKLSNQDILFISFCAGVGEEMLFRAALQPLVQNWTGYHTGIWITSVFFVAIHGYLNPLNWRLSIYGLLMTVIIGGIGYIFHEGGLIMAMAAHMFIDIVLLYAINNHRSRSEKLPIQDIGGAEE